MKGLQKLMLLLALTLPCIGFAAGMVNINTADKQTLMTEINGIGEARAEAIVTYREANGPFKSVDDLLNVKGVGEATLESNREKLTVSE